MESAGTDDSILFLSKCSVGACANLLRILQCCCGSPGCWIILLLDVKRCMYQEGHQRSISESDLLSICHSFRLRLRQEVLKLETARPQAH